MDLFIRRRIPIVIAGILMLVFAVCWVLYQRSQFRLVDSTPSIGSTISTATSMIELHFNRKLKEGNYRETLSGETSEVVQEIRVQSNIIQVSLNRLDEESDYNFIIRNITSQDDEVIPELVVNFKTVYIPYNKLSESQQELELNQTDRNNFEDPILKHLPHQDDRFYLESEFTTGAENEPLLVLNAQLFFRRDDLDQDTTETRLKYEKYVKDFIRSKELDPSKYNIRYEINAPPIR